jgi:hypothetical protein
VMVRGFLVTVVVAAIASVGSFPAGARGDASPKALGARERAVAVRVFFPRRGKGGTSCNHVFPRQRRVAAPAVLAGAMRALLRGPTAAERRLGYGGWFSGKTAGMFRSARIAGGTAYIDFRNFSKLIPNASSSCGSALLLAQLDRTATQFNNVRRAVYSFSGSRRAFYQWLQLTAPE